MIAKSQNLNVIKVYIGNKIIGVCKGLHTGLHKGLTDTDEDTIYSLFPSRYKFSGKHLIPWYQ